MGFHPEFSTFDRRPDDLDAARRTLWLWAEPVITDRAVEAYVRLLDEVGTVAAARKHCRLWRAVLFDRPSMAAPLLDDLHQTVAGLGLPEDSVDSCNDAITEELVDVVTSRYRSSRNSMRSFNMVLVAATRCLGAARRG